MKRLPVLTLLIIAFTLSFYLQNVFADDYQEEEPFTEVFSSVECISPAVPKVDAGAAIVMDVKSGRVLYEKNAYTRRAIASTTKIMTAILAIENGSLDDEVIVSKRAASVWGSKIHLKTGQVLKLEELLYGLMLNSGNDAAIVIAEHIGGTVENFAIMMTEKARQLGAKDTSFKSPHGLDMDGHYSTAYDLAVITRYALGNPLFSKIVGTRAVSIPSRNLHNTNEMLSAYPGADGVKTGYTGKAGRCLVTSATKDGWRIISVVLGCATRYKRAQSSSRILDYAFNSYKPFTLLEKGQCVKKLPVDKGVDRFVDVNAVESINIPMKEEEIDNIETVLDVPDRIEAPIYKDTVVGDIEFRIDGKVVASSQLKIGEDVRRKGFFDYLGDIFKVWVRISREGIFLEGLS